MNASKLFEKYKGAKVLVADDEISVIELVGYILESLELKCIPANDGAEAFQKFLEHKPDIVITDLFMPKMNGLQLAQEIQKINPNIPVIVMTGSISENAVIFSPNSHIIDVVFKPFKLTDVILVLKKALMHLEGIKVGEPVSQKNKLS